MQIKPLIYKTRPSWEEYALQIAETASIRSEDPFLKVGACALRHDNSVAALGYNGAPSKIDIDWSNRDERRKRVLHAENNALRYCKPGELRLLAVTLCPCSECMKLIGAYKIYTVVYREEYGRDTFSHQLAKEFGVKLIKL